MLLGFGHRQLNVDLLLSALEFFNKKICSFTDGKPQVVWWLNLSSATFEQEIAGAYARRECRTSFMDVLKHPSLTSIHSDALQSRVNGVTCRNIPHPRMAKAGVASLELGY